MANESFLAAMLQSLNQRGQGLASGAIQQKQSQISNIAEQLKQKREERLKLLTSGRMTPSEGFNAEQALTGEAPLVPMARSAIAQKPEGHYFGDSKTRKIYNATGDEVTDAEVLQNIDFNKEVKWSTGMSDMAVVRREMMEQRGEFKDRDQLVQLEKVISPLGSTRAGAIGQAGLNNIRAFRLIKTMNDPSSTSQEQTLAVADIAAIYKGGVPDEQLMRDADYRTLKQKYANFMTGVTSKPKAINTPEIRARLLKVARELIDVDNTMIQRNMGTKSKAYMPLLNRLQKGEIADMTPQQQKDWWTNLQAGVTEITREPEEPTQAGVSIEDDPMGLFK